jgi:hypothetical protein
LTFVLRIETGSVPFPNPVFETRPPAITELLWSSSSRHPFFIAVEIEKYLKRKSVQKPLDKGT